MPKEGLEPTLPNSPCLSLYNELPTFPLCPQCPANISCSGSSLSCVQTLNISEDNRPLKLYNFHTVVSPLFYPCNIFPLEQTPSGQFLPKKRDLVIGFLVFNGVSISLQVLIPHSTLGHLLPHSGSPLWNSE